MQQLSVRLVKSLEAETGVDPEFRQIGYLFVLTNDHQVDDFRRLVSMWQRLGVADARWVEPAEIRELAPIVRGDDILGGTFCPTDGIASPHAVTSAYAGAAKGLGVKIHEGIAVTGIDVRAGRVSAVKTAAGDLVTPGGLNRARALAGGLRRLAGGSVPVPPYPRNIFLT